MEKNCPLCFKELYSSIGLGCKMCGMPLREYDKEYCCNKCKKIYNQINKNKQHPRFNEDVVDINRLIKSKAQVSLC